MRRVPQIVLAATLLLGSGTSASAWVQSTSSKGAPLHWSDPCHTVYAHMDGSDDVEGAGGMEAIRLSLEAWNEVDCSGFTFLWAGLTNMSWVGYSVHGGNANVVIFREEAWPYHQRPVAFTSVTYDPVTGEIMDADLELNGEDYAFTALEHGVPGAVDIRNTVTHEAGHMLGLDHSPKVASTMYKSSILGETVKRSLDDDDVEGVCHVYPAADFPDPCREVETFDLWLDDPDAPPGPPSNPGCGVGPGSASSAAGLAGLLLVLLRRERGPR